MTILLHCLQKEFSQEEYSGTLMFLHNSDSHIFLIMEMKGGGGNVGFRHGELFQFTASGSS